MIIVMCVILGIIYTSVLIGLREYIFEDNDTGLSLYYSYDEYEINLPYG